MMNRKHLWRVVGAAMALAVVALPTAVPARAMPLAGLVNYGGIGNIAPNSLVAGPDGAMWFTAMASQSVGRITMDGSVALFSSIDIASPYDITLGSDGAMWFSSMGSHSIGRIATFGSITNYPSPLINTPAGIAAGADGALWFTNHGGSSIGRITTAGVVTDFTDPAISGAGLITPGPDGALWFTNYTGNSIGRITTAGVVTNFTDASINGPVGIATGPDGALWFTNYTGNSIGRITTAGVVSTFTDASINWPRDIAVGPDGALWFTNQLGNTLGRITTAGAVTSFADPLILSPAGIATGPDGAIWFTTFGNNSIARMPANDRFSVPRVFTGSNGFVKGGLYGATKEAGEPTPTGLIGGSSIWYSFTAPGAGTLTVDTCLSTLDTLLGVYTGTSVSTLTALGENDNAAGCGPGTTSSVTVPVTSGTEYHVEVDGKNGVIGQVQTRWNFIPAFSLSIGDVTVVEGDGGPVSMAFPVRLSSPSTTPVTVQYATSDLSATAPADYVAKTTQTLTIPPGAVSANIVVSVKGDGLDEGTENFFVNLSAPTGASLAQAVGLGTIQSVEQTAPTISIGDVSVVEGNSGAARVSFDATLSAAATTPVTTTWSISPGTASAGSDFVSATGTMTFAPGVTSATVGVIVRGDVAVEADETASIVLTNPSGATIADGAGTLTILNDDAGAATAISVGDVAASEGTIANHSALIPVRLATPQAGAVTVHYQTTAGTAGATDFVARSGTLTFAAGAVAANIAIPIVADAAHESNESFTVTLSAPTGGAVLSRGAGSITINDDDLAAAIISLGIVRTVEGNGGNAIVQLPVTLSQPQPTAVTFVVRTVAMAATTADFVPIGARTVTIPAGATSTVINITLKSDTTPEGTESFLIEPSLPVGATVGSWGEVTIRNDDGF